MTGILSRYKRQGIPVDKEVNRALATVQENANIALNLKGTWSAFRSVAADGIHMRVSEAIYTFGCE